MKNLSGSFVVQDTFLIAAFLQTFLKAEFNETEKQKPAEYFMKKQRNCWIFGSFAAVSLASLLTAGALFLGCPTNPRSSLGGNINSSIVPPGYFAQWNPGIPGGIPNVTSIHTTIAEQYRNGTTDATGAINSAIQAAGNAASSGERKVVYLPAGTYRIDKTILMNKSNVVLRGEGLGTVLRCINTGSGAITIGWEWPGYSGAAYNAVNVTGSPMAGDTKITVANAAAFKAGDILLLDRKPDDKGDPRGNAGGGPAWRANQVGGSEWRNNQPYHIRGESNTSIGPSSPDGYRPVKQYIEIDRIEGSTLYLKNMINIDFPSRLNPQLYKTDAEKYQYIGLENMKLEAVAGGNDVMNQWEYNPPVINMSVASSYCWVKNVESDGTKQRAGKGFKGRHITMWGFRNVVTGSYVHDSFDNRPGGNGYGIEIHGTDGLIDNNIADLLCKPILGYASGGGNVIAYNYIPNTETGDADGPNKLITWQESAIDTSHASYSHSDLYEGNYAANITTDNTSGNNGQMVIFRNYAWGHNVNGQTQSNLMALCIAGWNNEHASIGNVWLNPDTKKNNAVLWDNPQNSNSGRQAVYRIGTFAWDRSNGNGTSPSTPDTFNGGPVMGWTMSKFHRHLDYEYITNTLYNNPDNKVKTLPDSLYLTGRPDYFAGYTWPPVDPYGNSHKTRVSGLPAQDRINRY
jgi:hypothetical protein